MAHPSPLEEPVAAAAAARFGRRVRAYQQLSKLYVFDQYLGVPLAWSLLGPAAATAARTLAVLAACLVCVVAVVAASVALDDVQGFRDGSDSVNYGPREGLPRKRSRKPLLDGRLSERDALRFAKASAGLGLVALAAAFAVAPHRPLWVWVAAGGCTLASLQYSWGVKLSYVGLEEPILIAGTACTMLIPFGFVTGRATAAAGAEAALFGFWMMSVSVFSNTHDADGDRQVRRLTVPARVSARANRRFILVVFGCCWGLLLGGLLTGALPWWLALAILPGLALQMRQLRTGLGAGDNLLARTIGFKAYRAAIAALIASNLLAWLR